MLRSPAWLVAAEKARGSTVLSPNSAGSRADVEDALADVQKVTALLCFLADVANHKKIKEFTILFFCCQRLPEKRSRVVTFWHVCHNVCHLCP